MTFEFNKYHGTGNDFIMGDGIKHPELLDSLTEARVKKLCDRHFGIGADGLIILKSHDEYDFEMVYFNSDGRQSSMCGNGGRCIAQYAADLGYIQDNCTFIAIDGPHSASLSNEHVTLKMTDVKTVEHRADDVLLNTGSPHYLRFTDDLNMDDFIQQSKSIRHNDEFNASGVNVNFVKLSENHINMRTFERGVEDETLSCGTGVVAAGLASFLRKPDYGNEIEVKTKGGTLKVRFEKHENAFREIYLTGPVVSVFQGKIEI